MALLGATSDEAAQEVNSFAPADNDRKHPLDPLAASELEQAAHILRHHRDLGDSIRFASITLHEPGKTTLWNSPRQAFVVMLQPETELAFEAVVNLDAQSVTSLKQLPPGIQPSVMLDEFFDVERAVHQDPQFLDALARRGITNPDLVMVDPWSAGLYGNEPSDYAGKRLLRALCFVRSEPRDNGYARPIDSMVVVVDVNKLKVICIEEYGPVPLPAEPGNWAREYIPGVRTDLKPIEIIQPQGVSFKVDGHQVEWQKWKFRLSFNSREGLVLHTISYTDEAVERPILNRASICEMVVPYGDPNEPYYRKNAFDIGEYGIGMLANSLALGCDCLGEIHYFDFPLTDSRGQATMLKHAVCLHEEDYGILWKHTDWRTGQTEVRRSRRLSVSFIATVGNYEYGFYWYFYQDGSMQCEVKLTGIMNTATLKPGETPEYGVEVAPRLSAQHHQHIFAARLVPTIDGDGNSVYEVNTIPEPMGPGNPHGNAFKAHETLLATEKQAQRRVNSESARFWRIKNPNCKNRLGQQVAYRLIPGENCPPMADPNSGVMRRASFTRNHLWVTPYSPTERFAAGDYPNQHPTGDGLPVWTNADRSIENTDLSIWYVFGHNHIARTEDWPVMPVGMIGFHLTPDGFFDRNPGMDVPPTVPKGCCKT